jgi:hypothetical protein
MNRLLEVPGGVAVWGGLIGLLGACSWVSPVHAQADGDPLPRFIIESRDDLVRALGGFGDPDGAFPRSAIVALEGRRVLPWLLELARDESAGHSRLAALEVLMFTRDEGAIDVLIELAAEHGQVGDQARYVLAQFPHARACRFWRDLFRKPDLTFSETARAITGLGACGADADLDIVVPFLTSDRDGYRLVAGVAVERIRQGSARDTNVYLKTPPLADGSYVPTDSLAAIIRRSMCDGPCTELRVPALRRLRPWRRYP